MGMFEKKNSAPTPKKKKDEKRLVAIPGKEIDEAMLIAATLDAQIKNLTTKLNAAKAKVKEASQKEWLKIYKKEGINSGSFNVESDNGHTVMFVPTSRYGKIADEDTYNEMVETYGEENLEEETTYSFNTEVLMKNMEVIQELLEGSDKISDEDKENLINVTSTYNWKSDCIDKVPMLAKKSKNEIEDVIEDLAPVCSMKGFKENADAKK